MSAAPATKEERQAKRAARRAKQRVENAGRTAKMHASRLAFEKDFARVLAPSAEESLGKFKVGCSGWFYWHWRGGFYPEEMPTGDWFRHYADHFKTVELNAPFYSWPTAGTVRAWIRQAGAEGLSIP